MSKKHEQPEENIEQNTPEDSDPGKPTEQAATEEATGAEPTVDDQLEIARAEAEQNREKYLLAAAEAENIRKRAQNEIAQARKFAIEKFAAELLSVRDSLELASATRIDSENGEAMTRMREGLELTLKQLDSVFEKFEITALDPKGEKFNPDHHQAMTMVEHKELDPNHVVDVMQKGYLLKDRLLRPAMVVVSKAATDASSTEENKAEER
jgi:molecular chaperone GrpE